MIKGVFWEESGPPTESQKWLKNQPGPGSRAVPRTRDRGAQAVPLGPARGREETPRPRPGSLLRSRFKLQGLAQRGSRARGRGGAF